MAWTAWGRFTLTTGGLRWRVLSKGRKLGPLLDSTHYRLLDGQWNPPPESVTVLAEDERPDVGPSMIPMIGWDDEDLDRLLAVRLVGAFSPFDATEAM